MNVSDNHHSNNHLAPSSSRATALRGINDRVSRVEVICQESEAIATDTLGELANQRDTLMRARDRLADTNVELGTTNRTLKSVHRRIASNKLLLGFIILLELMIIGGQVYLKVAK